MLDFTQVQKPLEREISKITILTKAYRSNSELISEFHQNHPTAQITFKKKKIGTIMYVNNQTAYNTDDMGMYDKILRLKAMARAFNNSI